MRVLSAAVALAILCPGSRPAGAQPPPPPAEEAASPIRLNSIGYLKTSPKQATMTARGETFVVRDVRSGQEAARGPVVPLHPEGSPGEPVYLADFSELRQAGKFRVEVPGVGVSPSFDVADDLYNWPFYCCTRAMYLWRCGTSVEGQLAGQTFQHAACHLEDAYLDHAGGPAGELRDGVGGWHDAGDYGKYTVNGAFSAGMMLLAWEHFHDRLAMLELDIPESSNHVPDFLDEVRWELNWLLKMQADDGRVYHKITTLEFAEFVLPEKDTVRRYYSPWGSAATADFVAVMAQASRVFEPFDDQFAVRCLAAAEKSYRFLRANPQEQRPDQSAFSAAQYDTGDRDDRLWAAAELWETTGRQEYLQDFQSQLPLSSPGRQAARTLVDKDWDWSGTRNLGTFTYLLSSRSGRDPTLLSRVRSDALRVADDIVEAAGRHDYGRPLGDRYYWGCNGTVARLTINLHVADRLSPKPEYRRAMFQSLDYLFGRNPYGRSFVTGLGHRPPQLPHDRRSGGDDVELPWPGYLVGGPWPAATDWHDVWKDYRTNEIAINWNGALIYALAAFVEPSSFQASVAKAQRAAGATDAD